MPITEHLEYVSNRHASNSFSPAEYCSNRWRYSLTDLSSCCNHISLATDLLHSSDGICLTAASENVPTCLSTSSLPPTGINPRLLPSDKEQLHPACLFWTGDSLQSTVQPCATNHFGTLSFCNLISNRGISLFPGAWIPSSLSVSFFDSLEVGLGSPSPSFRRRWCLMNTGIHCIQSRQDQLHLMIQTIELTTSFTESRFHLWFQSRLFLPYFYQLLLQHYYSAFHLTQHAQISLLWYQIDRP